MSDTLVHNRTRRGSTFVDDIEFTVPNQPSSSGHLVIPDRPSRRTGILALHQARGDRNSLLADLRALAEAGFVGLAIDCAVSRRAAAARNPVEAHQAMLTTARAGLGVLRSHEAVDAGHIAVVGRGTGGSVAGVLASEDQPIDLVVTVNTPPAISSHYLHSDDPAAIAMRLRLDPAAIEKLGADLAPFDLITSIAQATETQWALSTADDDPSALQMRQRRSNIARTVRLLTQATSAELLNGLGALDRRALITRLSI